MSQRTQSGAPLFGTGFPFELPRSHCSPKARRRDVHRAGRRAEGGAGAAGGNVGPRRIVRPEIAGLGWRDDAVAATKTVAGCAAGAHRVGVGRTVVALLAAIDAAVAARGRAGGRRSVDGEAGPLALAARGAAVAAVLFPSSQVSGTVTTPSPQSEEHRWPGTGQVHPASTAVQSALHPSPGATFPSSQHERPGAGDASRDHARKSSSIAWLAAGALSHRRRGAHNRPP